jgi:D-alanyl-D-alanine carboxypeptidase
MSPHPTNPTESIDAWFERLGLPPDYAERFLLKPIAEADALVEIGQDIHGRVQRLLPETATAWAAMVAAAHADGIKLEVVSAYRSIDYQAGLIEKKIAQGLGLDEILKASAAPGFSEHHSGRAVDITTPNTPALEQGFAHTQAYAWLKTHAQAFEFVESYGPNNRHGLIWEPWHWAHAPFLI